MASKRHTYEGNHPVVPGRGTSEGTVRGDQGTIQGDFVMKPGPVLTRATRGKFRKGKKPKGVPSAAQVADRLAEAWGKD